MFKSMSLYARKELIHEIKGKYQQANWLEKNEILNGFIAVTDYNRKYAIQLLNSKQVADPLPRRLTSQIYDEQVRHALVILWQAANQICSKRLVPFLPELVDAMERHGHIRLAIDVKKRLLNISASTVDRLLKPEREQKRLSISTTKRGNLLKNKIQVRTFTDWDDVIPGFLEIDLVAHCGGNTNGPFLNTLVMVDISTGWLECMPMLRKSALDVIDGLNVAKDLLPFDVRGIDTDCGSEFINYELLDYCEERQITFTRARTHRKNDQAHVEEKNGSVIRRLVGYDRYEGLKAWERLACLYKILRKYINFFQPSLKLLSKERLGAKVSKKYDKAKTPYQRILLSSHINGSVKKRLTFEYKNLDPVNLLDNIQKLQDSLWNVAWNNNAQVDDNLTVNKASFINTPIECQESINPVNRFYHASKKIDLRKCPRTWRTRRDPFEKVWDEIRLRLELKPELNAVNIIKWLTEKHPEQSFYAQTRTLQRRIAQWRLTQERNEEKLRALMIT